MSFSQFESLFPQRPDLQCENAVTMAMLRVQPWLPIEDALCVIIAEALARKSRGRFILHLDDTDHEPLRGSNPNRTFNMLSWLDLSADEFRDLGEYGPYSLSARRHIPYQNEEVDIYKEAVRYLIEHDYAYFCFCRPDVPQIFNCDSAHEHQCCQLSLDEVTARLLAGEDHLIRFRVPRGRVLEYSDLIYGLQRFETDALEDFVLLTPQGLPMPYLAHVVDNHFMRVTTQVRRSSDLELVFQEMLLSRALGWQMPKLIHVPPIELPGADFLFEGICIDDFKQQGYLPQTILNYLTQLIWTHPEGYFIYPHLDFQQGFSVKNLTSTVLKLNDELLNRIQGGYTISKF